MYCRVCLVRDSSFCTCANYFLQPTTTSSPQESVATAAGPPVENLVSVSPADSPAKKSTTGEGVVASEGGSTAGNRLDDLIKSLQKGDASEENITTAQVKTYISPGTLINRRFFFTFFLEFIEFSTYSKKSLSNLEMS